MDAKPQRPRATRVNDENLLPSLPHAGKTLHSRTKSTPALSVLHAAGAIKAAQIPKKALGEANTNVVMSHKDDLEVGKASPAKQESLKDQAAVAPLARPAVRPLAPRAGFSQNTHGIAAAPLQGKPQGASKGTELDVEGTKKVGPKKSRILKDVETVAAAAAGPIKTAVAKGTDIPTIENRSVQSHATKRTSASVVIADSQQETHRTASVPLREEPAAAASSAYVGAHPADAAVVSAPSLPVSHIHSQASVVPVAPQNVLVSTFGHDNGTVSYNIISQTVDQFSDLDFDDDDGYATGRSMGHAGESTNGMTLLFAPQYTSKVKLEIAAARAHVEATRSTEDIEDEQWDTSMVAEYGDEIFDYMRQLEARMAPNSAYMDCQHEIQWSMRAVLLDWVIQVHNRFNLLPETLFLAVNYIDRFLSIKVVSMAKLQLVGATALFVAAKYEEVNCPTLSDVVFMVDGTYTADELLRAERFMLNMLQFELGWPGPLSFLRRISKADDYDLETRTLSKYFLEVTIMDERFVGCTPSFLAAGAHCLARIMLRKGEWTQAHVYYSNYTMSQLRRMVVAIYECCKQPSEHHAFVYHKYSDKRYKRASLFVRSEMDRGFTLALEFTQRTPVIASPPPSWNAFPLPVAMAQPAY